METYTHLNNNTQVATANVANTNTRVPSLLQEYQRHVIGYNNYGVNMMDVENYPTAIASLSRALKLSRSLMHLSPSSSPSPSSSNDNNKDNFDVDYWSDDEDDDENDSFGFDGDFMSTSLDDYMQPNHMAEDEDDEDEDFFPPTSGSSHQQQQQHLYPQGIFEETKKPGDAVGATGQQQQQQQQQYVYREPVCIPNRLVERRSTGNSNYQISVLVSTFVTFNLAMANQLYAMSMTQQPQQQRELFQRAAKLYELAYSMQREEDFIDGNTLFTLATINNLGLCHAQVDEVQEAQKCFEYLLSTLMLIMTDHRGPHGVVSYIDMEGFFRNVSILLLQSNKPCSAPAA